MASYPPYDPSAYQQPAAYPPAAADPNAAYYAAAPPPAYGAPPPAYGYQPHPDEVRTLFLTGFPEDVKERELNNLLRFLPAYEVRWRRVQRLLGSWETVHTTCTTLLEAAELCHTGISNAPQEWHGTRICLISKWCCGKSSCGQFAQHGVSCHTLPSLPLALFIVAAMPCDFISMDMLQVLRGCSATL